MKTQEIKNNNNNNNNYIYSNKPDSNFFHFQTHKTMKQTDFPNICYV